MQDLRNYGVKFRKLLALVRNPRYLGAYLRYGVAPGIEHERVLKAAPITMVVDVGANRGQFSLVVTQWLPAARIVAFEPLPGPAGIFRSLFAANPNITLHEVALGSEHMEMEMNISRRDDSSSLLPIARLQTDNFPGTERVATRKVPVAPLSFFLSPDEIGPGTLLKIDVQGYELPVLRSAEAILSRFDWVYAECSFEPLYEGQALVSEIEVFLARFGFSRSRMLNPTYARHGGKMLQADFLFENRARRRAASLTAGT